MTNVFLPPALSLSCVALLGLAHARADAHLTVCNGGSRDAVIYEAFNSRKNEWTSNSPVFVGKSQCVTFDDSPRANEKQFYLRVLNLYPKTSHSFTTTEVLFHGPTRSFCAASGTFSRRKPAYTIAQAESESQCTYYAAHVHDSGEEFQWLRFFSHTIPRPTTRLRLE